MKTKLEIAFKMKQLKSSLKISPAVVISGLLTLMYCVEFSIGIRTIYYTFKLWNDPYEETTKKRVSWTLCLACLLTATITSFTVNILSAIWEQKQLEEKGKPKSFVRFLCHFIVGGMIWRYFHLWCLASKQVQKKGALLLTMTKFFFTQTFTIPMVIIHVSVTENIDEMIFAFVNIFCISFNLILTCTMFSICSKEVEELKKWDYETVDLIPLLFQWDPPVPMNNNFKVASNFTGKQDPKHVKKESRCEKIFEEIIVKTLVLFQTFGFSLGRLMALGILVKLAGIYAVSIMFLQLLISVIYLKFQVPILVSDTLPKWRQLTRLSFLGYILIFEWHLNREPRTAYDFSFNGKHNILYYCVATVESVFYLVTWTVTTSILSKSEIPEIRDEQNTFCRLILVIGSLALVFSLSIHILLLFWRSRRMSKFFYSFRRRYEKTKIRFSNYGGRNVQTQEKAFRRPPISHIDISNPIPQHRNDMSPSRMHCHLEKQTSYRDLREPVDEEIEIFRKCENRSRSNPKLRDIRRGGMMQGNYDDRARIQAIDHALREEVNNYQNARYTDDRRFKQAPNVPTVTCSSYSPGKISETRIKSDRVQSSEHSFKSRVGLFSDNISDHFEKMSRKISGAVKEHFQRKKDKTRSPCNSPSNHTIVTVHRKIAGGNLSPNDGCYVGDQRCYRIEYSPTRASVIHQHISPRNTRYGEEDIRSPSVRRTPSPGRSPSYVSSYSPRRSPSPMRSPSAMSSRSPMRSASPFRSGSPTKSSPFRSGSPTRSPYRSGSPTRSSPYRSGSPTRSSSFRSASGMRCSSPTRSGSPIRSTSPMPTSSSRLSPTHEASSSHRLSPSPRFSSSSPKFSSSSPKFSSSKFSSSPAFSPSPEPSSPKNSPGFSHLETPPPKITPSPMFSSPRIAPPPCLASSPRKSPGNDKSYDSSHAHKSTGSPCPCYICKNSGDNRFGQRRRSSSVPPGETSLKETDEDSPIRQTSSKYQSNPNITRSDCRSRDTENASTPPRVSRRNFNIGHLTAHGRVEHYV